jgi:hypothetical protein
MLQQGRLLLTGLLLACLPALLPGCKKEEDIPKGPPPAPSPVISSINPKQGEVGTIVQITGKHFSVPKVYFGSVEATEINVSGDTTLKVKVPAGIGDSSRIKVVINGQEIVADDPYIITLRLGAFSPVSIERQKTLTITGKGFDPLAEVWLNDNRLTITSFSATTLEVQVPVDAVDGKIKIKQPGAEKEFATSLHIFNYWKTLYQEPDGADQTDSERHFVYKNKIYRAFGSSRITGNPYNQVNSFDPTTNTWSVAFTIPAKVPLRRLHFSVVKGDKWYIGTGEGVEKNCWVMDLTKSGDEAWTQLTDFPDTGIFERAFLLNDEIYVTCETYGKKIYRLDAAANGGKGSWIPLITTGTPGYNGDFFTGFFVLGNKAYLRTNAKKLYEFDPVVPSFVEKATTPDHHTWDPVMFTFNGKGYGSDRNALYMYDPATNTWTRKTTLPFSDMMASVLNNKVYVITIRNGVYEYVPE